VDEATAWLNQARSDRTAGDRAADPEDTTTRCHALAKYQQAVEKAVKGLAAALRLAGIGTVAAGWRHDAEPFVSYFVRLPRGEGAQRVQAPLRRLFDPPTRDGIRALDSLAPRRPPPGQPLRRNTEYPYHDGQGGWIYPAVEGAFSDAEVRRFRALAYRIVDGAGRMASAVRRGPK
jgi:hypothetical protein